MPIKLIAMDLDGTLMSEDHITVTEKTKKALFKANKRFYVKCWGKPIK